MTTTTEQMRAWTGPAILTFGFRPFFFGAAVWAVLAMALWVPMLSGYLMLPTTFDPVSWHAHEFLFGYLGAVVAGFLLTAVPNWDRALADRRLAVGDACRPLAGGACGGCGLSRFARCVGGRGRSGVSGCLCGSHRARDRGGQELAQSGRAGDAGGLHSWQRLFPLGKRQRAVTRRKATACVWALARAS